MKVHQICRTPRYDRANHNFRILETIEKMTRLPLAEPNLSGNEARYLQECVDSGFVSSVGPFVTRLEQHIVDATEADHAVAVTSGTCGLHLALQVLGVQPGDLVIVPSYSFIASANAIAHCGASPWFMDVEADSWNLDPELLRLELASATMRDPRGIVHKPSGRRVAAIMAVYALGLPADMDRLTAVAAAFDLPVLADAAAGLGATWKDQPIGCIGADLSVVSLNGNKTVTAGGGGVIFGNDVALLDRARHLSTTARASGDAYLHDAVGYNYRMTNLQAAVGCAQMERLEELVSAKRHIDQRYRQAVAKAVNLSPPPTPDQAKGSCWISAVLVETKNGKSAEGLREALLAADIEARQFWRPLHQQPAFEGSIATAMPVVEAFWRNVVPLPCSTHLSAGDQDRVINVLESFEAA
jgi:dTDP-4-amino-4,6-dideoxygalactose transaminase